MADVSVTATSVAVASDTVIERGFAGATITAGQTVYLSSSGTWLLADANASATTANVQGIALNGAASGQPVAVAVGGSLNPGFTVTVGAVYVLSATAGGIAPVADLATGWYTGIVGVGITSSNLRLIMFRAGVAVP